MKYLAIVDRPTGFVGLDGVAVFDADEETKMDVARVILEEHEVQVFAIDDLPDDWSYYL